ncbi:hypothetical protein PVAP13_9KG112500 [Panicum virgatum]|uniref:Acyl carrier protein n=1 Tax=Panicum virgatum TaxID=38727 RepID=A0A8T0NE51_PANVG|nr:hypothetical protein PVAP13_9KG112500 [Panicum virgatum]
MNEVQPREEETSGLGLHDQAQNHIHNLPARSPCRRHLQALQRPPRREPHVREAAAAAAASPFCCRGFQTLLLACLHLVHRSIFVYLSSARCKRRKPLCCSTCGSARRPPSQCWWFARGMSAPAGGGGDGGSGSESAVRARVVELVRRFDKIDADKVTETADFQKDLSLDSLDRVELVMAFEQEFSIEIPDDKADKLTCCADVAKYIISESQSNNKNAGSS